jgi:two-component system CheB/CheR fusion protein
MLPSCHGEKLDAGRAEGTILAGDDTERLDDRLEAAIALAPVVYVVDDDGDSRGAIRSVLELDGHVVEDYGDAESFLEAYKPGRDACLLIDANLPGISGLNLLRRLKDTGHPVPAIMITGQSDVPTAVEAMKAGASDFLEKPIRGIELLGGVARALELSRDVGKLTEWRKDAAEHLAGLTRRQRQIMQMVLAGHPSKNIAVDLGISRRTVESHRASIMKKAGVRSLPALARLALVATGGC